MLQSEFQASLDNLGIFCFKIKALKRGRGLGKQLVSNRCLESANEWLGWGSGRPGLEPAATEGLGIQLRGSSEAVGSIPSTGGERERGRGSGGKREREDKEVVDPQWWNHSRL